MPLVFRFGVSVLVLACAVLTSPWGAAQDATPVTVSGTPVAHQPNVLLQATLERTTPGPLELRLLRIVLDPDSQSPLHAHPGLELGVVESGTLIARVAGLALMQQGSDGEPQPVPEGVEVRLATGDRIAYAPGTQMTFRNPGPQVTVLLAATILPAGSDAPPGAIYPAGTPTAEEAAGVQSQLLGTAVVSDFPSGQAAVILDRLQLRAGEPLPGFAGPLLIGIESGALSGSVLEGSVETAGTPPDPSSSAEGALSLGPGQSILLPRGMAETLPLGGGGRVVLLRLGLLPLGGDATPAAPTVTPVAPTAAIAGAYQTGDSVVVVVVEARLRGEPSLDGPLVAGLPQGSELVIIGAPLEGSGFVWYPVQAANDPALTGYVAAELITPAG